MLKLLNSITDLREFSIRAITMGILRSAVPKVDTYLSLRAKTLVLSASLHPPSLDLAALRFLLPRSPA